VKKQFVLDTNVLLHNPESIDCFEDNDVILPMEVIEELDRFKRHADERGRNARSVIRKLDVLRKSGSLGKGVATSDGGTLRVLVDDTSAVDIPGLASSVTDNRIVRAAVYLSRVGNGRKVIFVSKDINARIKADAIGLPVMDFEREKINFEEIYSGWRELEHSLGPGKETVDIHKSGFGPYRRGSQAGQ